MSYLVLARKYRPKTFEQLVGQSHVVQALTNALRTQRLHHAYLFTGTRGVGKTTVSRILAKSLNCETGITDTPCGVCAACTDIDAGHFVDYTELDAASNRSVDEIQQLLEQAVYKPVQGRFKVFMIDEVHMLTGHAFNAMLKTLEEPPVGTTIVLVTQQEDRLLPTIRSRCQRVAFGPLSADAMRAWWEREGPKVDPADRSFLEAFAAGSPGMAAMAADHGIAGWNRELAPQFDALESGRYPAGLAERMAEIADGFAKGIVDKDENASKEAANRLATRLLAQLMGLRIRAGLERTADDPAAVERWLGAEDVLREFERQLRSNVNIKFACADLVAQWAERTVAPGAARGR
jgi:DNA polymerase-3 subunit gamma/tau